MQFLVELRLLGLLCVHLEFKFTIDVTHKSILLCCSVRCQVTARVLQLDMPALGRGLGMPATKLRLGDSAFINEHIKRSACMETVAHDHDTGQLIDAPHGRPALVTAALKHGQKQALNAPLDVHWVAHDCAAGPTEAVGSLISSAQTAAGASASEAAKFDNWNPKPPPKPPVHPMGVL